MGIASTKDQTEYERMLSEFECLSVFFFFLLIIIASSSWEKKDENSSISPEAYVCTWSLISFQSTHEVLTDMCFYISQITEPGAL